MGWVRGDVSIERESSIMSIFCSDEEEEKEEKVYNPRCRGELREWRQVNGRNTWRSSFQSCNKW
jgi:hypothetical protein